MVQITAIEAAAARVPLPQPVAFSNRLVSDRYYTLVRVHGSDGVTGIGFCYEGNRSASLATTAVRELLSPVVIGADAHGTEGIWDRMYQETLLNGRAGSVMRALSAIDIALWDRNARSSLVPLWKYLGGGGRPSVPAYASGGYYREGDNLESTAHEVAAHVESGFRAVKIKVGRLPAVEDAERLAAIRRAVGPDVVVMLDANNAWSDVKAAERAINRFAPYDPYWIEEPFSPDDVTNHARLRRSTSVPVATGEVEAGRWRHMSLLDADAADYYQTDAAVCGGITEWRRIAALVDGFGRTMAPHWFHDLHAHLVACTPAARWVEYFPDNTVLNFRDLIEPQMEVADGRLSLSESPGLGFDFSDDALSAYLVDGWS